MHRHPPLLAVIATAAVLLLSGCRPQQPFYFFEDGDLSHYVGVATDMDYPDVENPSLGEVEGAIRPFSLENREPREHWDLSLEEAVQIALANSKVFKSLGGAVLSPPDHLIHRKEQHIYTIYDPAVMESSAGGRDGVGVEAALAAFDAQFAFVNRWEKFTEPRNTVVTTSADGVELFDPVRQDDQGTFEWQVTKVNATGGRTTLAHRWFYLDSNSPTRRYASDWTATLRAEIRQPLLQGGGIQFNRIAGPGATPGIYSGVMLARINTDIALCDFEQGVAAMVHDVEATYWELYYSYLQQCTISDSLTTAVTAAKEAAAMAGAGGGNATAEAVALNHYHHLRSVAERSLTDLYQAESKLRYLMGLASTDGRLIRPVDEPTTAKIAFDWCDVHAEAMARSSYLREQRWHVKASELELIASKNHLLPKLDLVASYQWIGLGEELIESSGGTGDFRLRGSNAFQSLTGGDFANWTAGVELSFPIGFRREMAGVRNAQLRVARDRAVLQEAELEVSHQLAFALRDLESKQVLLQTLHSRRIAADRELKTVGAKLKGPPPNSTMNEFVEAMRRALEADNDYYRALVDYNKAIIQVHLRKGSLLEYDNVYLSEGPWTAKAYFDAKRRARQRDASMYMNYGYTLPQVVSRGPVDQGAGAGTVLGGETIGAGTSQTPTLAPPQVPALPAEPAEAKPTDNNSERIAPPRPEPKAAEGPLMLLPNTRPADAAGATSGGPNARAASGWAAAKNPRRPAGGYDIGAMDLSGLAGKGGAAGASGSAVRPAAHTEPVAKDAGRWTTSAGRSQWSDPQPTTAAATPATSSAGWKNAAK